MFYPVYTSPREPEYFDDVEVKCCDADVDDKGHKAKVIQVGHRWHACGPLKLGREQAFKLASALMRAALNFEPNEETGK
jgi:hypothetical protein